MNNEDKDFIIEFSKRKKKTLLAFALLLIILFLSFFYNQSNQPYMNIFYVSCAIVFLVFLFFTYRCPNCEKYLGQHQAIKYCTHCSVQLVDKDS